MAQQVGVLAALAKDPGSLATTCDPSLRDDTLFRPRQVLHSHDPQTHVHASTYTHKINLFKINKDNELNHYSLKAI